MSMKSGNDEAEGTNEQCISLMFSHKFDYTNVDSFIFMSVKWDKKGQNMANPVVIMLNIYAQPTVQEPDW